MAEFADIFTMIPDNLPILGGRSWKESCHGQIRLGSLWLPSESRVSKVALQLTLDAARIYRVSTGQVTPEVAPEATPEAKAKLIRLLSAMEGEMTSRQMQEQRGLKDEEHFREAYLLQALQAHVIERTVPDKPK